MYTYRHIDSLLWGVYGTVDSGPEPGEEYLECLVTGGEHSARCVAASLNAANYGALINVGSIGIGQYEALIPLLQHAHARTILQHFSQHAGVNRDAFAAQLAQLDSTPARPGVQPYGGGICPIHDVPYMPLGFPDNVGPQGEPITAWHCPLCLAEEPIPDTSEGERNG